MLYEVITGPRRDTSPRRSARDDTETAGGEAVRPFHRTSGRLNGPTFHGTNRIVTVALSVSAGPREISTPRITASSPLSGSSAAVRNARSPGANSREKRGEGKERAVITSYSIHYTKLYDPLRASGGP